VYFGGSGRHAGSRALSEAAGQRAARGAIKSGSSRTAFAVPAPTARTLPRRFRSLPSPHSNGAFCPPWRRWCPGDKAVVALWPTISSTAPFVPMRTCLTKFCACSAVASAPWKVLRSARYLSPLSLAGARGARAVFSLVCSSANPAERLGSCAFFVRRVLGRGCLRLRGLNVCLCLGDLVLQGLLFGGIRQVSQR
jgi:hypothetical protein